MKKTNKNILKAVVLAALLCSSVFAEEGDMGSGGKTCPQGQQTCLTGDMGSGGLTSSKVETHEGDSNNTSDDEGYLDSVLGSVYLYFGWAK